jgi:hypothetical protein
VEIPRAGPTARTRGPIPLELAIRSSGSRPGRWTERASPDASDAERHARIERARKVEREAVLTYRQLIRTSEERYELAVRRLAELDALLAATKAMLRGMGYLR